MAALVTEIAQSLNSTHLNLSEVSERMKDAIIGVLQAAEEVRRCSGICTGMYNKKVSVHDWHFFVVIIASFRLRVKMYTLLSLHISSCISKGHCVCWSLFLNLCLLTEESLYLSTDLRSTTTSYQCINNTSVWLLVYQGGVSFDPLYFLGLDRVAKLKIKRNLNSTGLMFKTWIYINHIKNLLCIRCVSCIRFIDT